MKQNKLTIIFFSLLVALAFTACNDDLLEKHPCLCIMDRYWEPNIGVEVMISIVII